MKTIATTVATSGSTYSLVRDDEGRLAVYLGTARNGCLVDDDLGTDVETALEEFEYRADRADEETRILVAQAAAEFGPQARSRKSVR